LPYECSREEAHHKRHSAHKQHPKARFQYWPFGEFGCAHAQEKQSRQGNYYRKREGDFYWQVILSSCMVISFNMSSGLLEASKDISDANLSDQPSIKYIW